MVGHVFAVELQVQLHFHWRGFAARRIDVLPRAVAAQQPLVECIERIVAVEPVFVLGDGVVVVGGIRLRGRPRAGVANAVPSAPDAQGLVIFVARHKLAQITLDIDSPHWVVEVVGHGSVGGKCAGRILLYTAVAADDAHVRVGAQHPGRAGHVGA